MLESFLAQMCDHIKARMAEPGRESFSDWVTWASWPPSDPLRTGGNPISVPALDYASFNAYSYDPERIRDHQSGPVTGTPYAGYLAALKARFPTKPVVVAESGLPDSPAAVGLDQARLPPLAPSYRRGALTPEQAGEGIADRYWDARLSGTVAGFGLFEWNDEWWKTGDPNTPSSDPEEHFGLARFATTPAVLLRFKLQQEVVRELYTMRLPSAVPVLTGVAADSLSLPPEGTTAVHAQVAPEAVPPVRFRWEASRGRIAGAAQTVEFHAGGRALGPAVVTVVAVDALGNATRASVTIGVQPASAGSIEILTFGPAGASAGRSSGRVTNVDLGQNKVVLYVRTNQYYVQPYGDMRSIWVENDGHWWSSNFAFPGDAPSLYAWVVPSSFDPPATMTSPPAAASAGAVLNELNDADDDLLPDAFEPGPGDRYDDADGDGSTSLEELLNGTDPGVADNDADGDGLPDTWEKRYFGSLAYGSGDDPDGDGLDDGTELQNGTHPGRRNVDSDLDGLPDGWELQRFGDLSRGPLDVDGSGVTNLDAYELGWPPGQDFFTLPPCRMLDTRAPDGPLGGPALQPAGSPPRSFPVTASACGIPPTARAISVNVTVDQPAADGYLTLFAGNAAVPPTSGISFRQGKARANNGILQLATDLAGTIRVRNGAPGSVHLILDVNGYFQ